MLLNGKWWPSNLTKSVCFLYGRFSACWTLHDVNYHTFDIHGELWARQPFVYQISLFLVNEIEKLGKQTAASPIVIHGYQK